MGRATRIALAVFLVSIAAAPHASAQRELTFSLFERHLDSLRVQGQHPGRVGGNRPKRARSAGNRPRLFRRSLEQCVETGHLARDPDTMAAMSSNGSGMPTGLGWFVQNCNGQALSRQFGNTPGADSSLILRCRRGA